VLQVFGQDTNENENPVYNPLTDKEGEIKQTNAKKVQSKNKDKYPYKDWVLQEKERKQPYLSRIKEITNIYSLMVDTAEKNNSDAIHEALASINFSYGKGRLAMPYFTKQNTHPIDTSAEEKGDTDKPQTTEINLGQDKINEDITTFDFDTQDTEVFLINGEEEEEDPRGPIPQESINVPAFSKTENKDKTNTDHD